jgi:hypothetical protein
MNKPLLLLLFFFALSFAQDAIDSTTSRFLARGDGDRRVMLNQMWKTNPGQIWQVAYGFKRLKLIDLLKAYIPPSISDIVLYGSYSFTIQTGPQCSLQAGELSTVGFPKDILTGLYLSAHRYVDGDKRDSRSSTYVHWHSAGAGAKRWKFTPVSSSIGGVSY